MFFMHQYDFFCVFNVSSECHYSLSDEMVTEFTGCGPTVGPHEDIGKFPNCLNSIPNEYLGLKKENEQKFFCKYV